MKLVFLDDIQAQSHYLGLFKLNVFKLSGSKWTSYKTKRVSMSKTSPWQNQPDDREAQSQSFLKG